MFAAILSLLLFSVPAVAAERDTPPPPLAVHGGEGTRFAEPGMIAPDFTVLDVEGNPFRLSEEVSRKPVLLLFWSVFCDPCRAEMANLQKAHDKYAGRDLSVVAVAVDGGALRNTIRGFARQEGYTFKVLVDELDAVETWKVADAYGVAVTPTLLLLEKGGKVSLRKGGKVREDEIEKAVSSLLKK
ncbi:peroxiredoxin [Candidatus Deferrimicrobium sp.]|uniref:peroxiredoxin family protein n=1 Tax=Candidatus Deferrimicrobium sp. TaxID=3060586 RepID=UPI00272ADF2F|nr:TlpA disulfide reductase family protein [Candidatus Deferrimicrobium sp.]